MPPKIKITSKKRTAQDAGIFDNDDIPSNIAEKADIKQKQEQDISKLAASGIVNRYEAEIPQENAEEETKRRAKKDYQKRKVKKQKMNKKGLEVVSDDNDFVKLYQNKITSDSDDDTLVPITNLTYHLGIQNKKTDLKYLKKKKRLNMNLLANDDDHDVLLQQSDIQHVINNPKNKLLPTKQLENTNGKKNVEKKSMLSNEVSSQLALLSMVADTQEAKIDTRIKREKSKNEFFEEKERKKLEKKEKEKAIRNLVLNEVRHKNKQQRELKKELKKAKD